MGTYKNVFQNTEIKYFLSLRYKSSLTQSFLQRQNGYVASKELVLYMHLSVIKVHRRLRDHAS